MAKEFPDEYFMKKVKEGSTLFLSTLYDRHHAALYKYIYFIVKNENLTKDILQDTFIRIFKYKESFKDHMKFKPWLFTIARNLAYNSGKIKVDQASGEIKEDFEEMNLWEMKEHKIHLDAALSNMDPQKRELISMQYFQHMNYEEISELLDLTVNNVRVKMHRALNELKKEYVKLSNVY
jgi:RNA polymerase sigma-70 factor (ECF subfamily)